MNFAKTCAKNFRIFELVAALLLVLPVGASAGEPGAKKDRSPASVAIPKGRVGEDPFRAFRVPMLSAPKNAPRWRLMGTCRQDIGMFQSQNGVGYGNCAN